MKIEDFKINQVVYNEDNEELTVKAISGVRKGKERIYACRIKFFDKILGKWYEPSELTNKPTEWVDLGLSSGTLWKSDIERDIDGKPLYLSWKDAKEKYKNLLPKSWQFVELYEECTWKWSSSKNGYSIVGPNRNEIFLPACGYRSLNHNFIKDEFESGLYWSIVSFEGRLSRNLYFNSSLVSPQSVSTRASGLNIILCKK